MENKEISVHYQIGDFPEIFPRAALTLDFEKRSHHGPRNQDGGLKPEAPKKKNGRRHVGCRSSSWFDR